MTFLLFVIFPQAQSKQTVVKLEDSSRDKIEEGRKSEGLLKVRTTTKGGSVVVLFSRYT